MVNNKKRIVFIVASILSLNYLWSLMIRVYSVNVFIVHSILFFLYFLHSYLESRWFKLSLEDTLLGIFVKITKNRCKSVLISFVILMFYTFVMNLLAKIKIMHFSEIAESLFVFYLYVLTLGLILKLTKNNKKGCAA